MFYDCLILMLVNNWYNVASIFFDSDSSVAMDAAESSMLLTWLLSCAMAAIKSDMEFFSRASVDILYACEMSDNESDVCCFSPIV